MRATHTLVLLIALTGCRAESGSGADGIDSLTENADGTTDGTGTDGTSDDDSESTEDELVNGREDIACDPGVDATPLSISELGGAGPFEVFSKTETFYDTTRPSTSDNTWWGPDGRKLETKIWFPGSKEWWEIDAEVDGQDLPLVVYSHGFSSSRDEGELLGEHLASHGYIVIAPTFPMTNMMASGGPDMIDTVNQPGDVSFLIDQMLAKSMTSSSPFHGAIDADRIAAAGTSMGGMTTSLVTYHRTLHDDRIKAAATFAGPGSMFDTSFYDHRAVPLLALHGDLDAIVDYEYNAERTRDRAAPYATLVTIAEGSHTAFAPIPFEEMVLPLMGALVAPEGSHEDNPDRLGCGMISDNMPEDGSFMELIGGAADGMIEADDPMPCDMAFLSEPAMDPDDQRDIAVTATLAFFEAYLAEDAARRESACLFLEDGLLDMGGVDVDSTAP